MNTDQDPTSHTGFLTSLRAVRRYADRPVDAAALDDILDVARWTGSGKNRQPWNIVVVEERTTLEELARCGDFAAHVSGAAMAAVLVMDDAGRQFDEGRLAHNLMLAAWAHGVGSCIATFSSAEDVARVRELLGLPDDRWVRHCIAFGYPEGPRTADIGQLPTRTVPRGRKALSEFVHRERFGTTAEEPR
jgi:nitroreductase